MRKQALDDLLLVGADQHHRTTQLLEGAHVARQTATDLLMEMDDLDALLGLPPLPPTPAAAPASDPSVAPHPPFSELVGAARQKYALARTPTALIPPHLHQAALARHRELRRQAGASRALNRREVTVSCLVGVISGLVSGFFFAVPRHTGAFGREDVAGGPASNWVRDRLDRLISPEQQRWLEKTFKVSYDAPHSARLENAVAGMGPNTHRLNSLGHDSLIGFIVGMSDLLTGQMTAVDKFGKIIVNQTGFGMPFFEALITQIGHLASDATTTRGLPAPLAGLFQFIRIGKFGEHGYTVADLSRQMYLQNYDLRHWIGLGIPVLLTELLIRVFYFFSELAQGRPVKEALPFGNRPKLQRMLLISHAVATAGNAGHLIFTQNPLVLNAPQWVALAKYAVPEVHWQVRSKRRALQQLVDQDLESLLSTLQTRQQRQPVHML